MTSIPKASDLSVMSAPTVSSDTFVFHNVEPNVLQLFSMCDWILAKNLARRFVMHSRRARGLPRYNVPVAGGWPHLHLV